MHEVHATYTQHTLWEVLGIQRDGTWKHATNLDAKVKVDSVIEACCLFLVDAQCNVMRGKTSCMRCMSDVRLSFTHFRRIDER